MYLGIIILSIIVALARKGRLKNVQHYKAWFLLILALIIYAALIAGPLTNIDFVVDFIKDYSYWLYFAVYVLIMITVVFNLNNIWSFLLILGVALNFTATFLNGGKMPVLQSASEMANSDFALFFQYFGATNQLTASTPYVMPLCKVIGIPSLPISIGDIIITIALFMVIQLLLVRPVARKSTPKDIADYTGKLNFTSELKIDEIIQAAGEESIDEFDSFLPSLQSSPSTLSDDIILGETEKGFDLHKDPLISNMEGDMILGGDATKSPFYQEQEDFLASDSDDFILPDIDDASLQEDSEEYDHVFRVLDEIKDRQDSPTTPIASMDQEEWTLPQETTEEFFDESVDEELLFTEQPSGEEADEQEDVLDEFIEEVPVYDDAESVEEEAEQLVELEETDASLISDIPAKAEETHEEYIRSETMVSEEELLAQAQAQAEQEAAQVAAKAQAEAELQQNVSTMLQYMKDLFEQSKQQKDALAAQVPSGEKDQTVEETVQATDIKQDVSVSAKPETRREEAGTVVIQPQEDAQTLEDDDSDDENNYPFIIKDGRIVENENYKFHRSKSTDSKSLDVVKDVPSIYDSTFNLEKIRKEIFEELQRQEQEALSPLAASSAQNQTVSSQQQHSQEELDSIFEKEGAPQRSKEARSALTKDTSDEYERVAFEIDGKINYVWIKK